MITARYNNGRHPVLLGERKRCGHKGFAAFAVTVNITTNNISFRDRPTGPASISRLPCANTTGLPILPPCLDLSTEWMFANRRHQMVAKQALFIWYMKIDIAVSLLLSADEKRFVSRTIHFSSLPSCKSCAFNYANTIKCRSAVEVASKVENIAKRLRRYSIKLSRALRKEYGKYGMKK